MELLVNLVTSKILAFPLRICTERALGSAAVKWVDVRGNSVLSGDILLAKYWILEAFAGVSDPSGFRTALKIADNASILLLFTYTPPGMPLEGEHWCNILHCDVIKKIKEGGKTPPPGNKLEKLIDYWPLLGCESSKHHHGI